MEIKIETKNFKKVAKEYIDQGWLVEKVEKIEYYKIKLTNFSKIDYEHRQRHIPFVYHLDLRTLKDICKVMSIDCRRKKRITLINELEIYKPHIVKMVWDSVLKSREKNNFKTVV